MKKGTFESSFHVFRPISVSDVETSSVEQTSSCSGGSTMSTLQLHTPGFGVQSRRSIVLPKPMPHIEFPAPPPPFPELLTSSSSAYDCYASVPIPAYQSPKAIPTSDYDSSRLRRSSQCCDCIDDGMPLYATGKRNRRRSSVYGSYDDYATIQQPVYLERFALSKKGLLQIDYSCNWNHLQKMIGK